MMCVSKRLDFVVFVLDFFLILPTLNGIDMQYLVVIYNTT